MLTELSFRLFPCPMMPALDSLRFGPHLDVAARTSAGADPLLRLENQDNFLLIDIDGHAVFMLDQQEQRQRVPGWTQGHARLAVLDGMGGHGHGRQAAEAVAAGLLRVPACASLDDMNRHLNALHASLQRRFAPDEEAAKRPGTTLTMLELRPGEPPLLYHVGDSRLYEILPGRVSPMTVDHVPATALAMAGLLGEEEWWHLVHGEHRPQISQAFILGNAFANPALLSDGLFELSPLNLPPFLSHLPDRRAIELLPNAVYLLATDGFWACAAPAEWVKRWPALLCGRRNAHAIAEALFDELENNPPPDLHIDNLTAIVLRLRPQGGHRRRESVAP
jgi:serine/threonine protein phosphatase PrpC